MAWEFWKRTIEADFDAAPGHREKAAALMAQRPECVAHRARLEAMREGVRAVVRHETIDDAQFSAFMDGIREGLREPAPRWGRAWAAMSLTAAGIVAALALWSIFSGGAEPVSATEVEYVGTDVEDATVDWYNSSNGVTTIRLDWKGGDM